MTKTRWFLYSVALALNCLLVVGCNEQAKQPPNSTYSGYLDATRPAGVPNCYVIEYKGQEYIVNSKGGIVAVPAQ